MIDRFAGSTLAPAWTWLRTPGDRWWRTGRRGLVVTPPPDSLGGNGPPGLLLIRQSQPDATARVTLCFAPAAPADRAGLVAFADTTHFFALTVAQSLRGGCEVRLERRAGQDDTRDGLPLAQVDIGEASGIPIGLRIKAQGGAYRFAYRIGLGRWRPVGGVQDGTILSTHTAGGFTGTILGLYARAANSPSTTERRSP